MMNAQDPRIRPWIVALGQVVRDRRKNLGMSQDTLAAEADCNRQSVNRIENAKFVTDVGRFVLLAAALGMSRTELSAQTDSRAELNAQAGKEVAV